MSTPDPRATRFASRVAIVTGAANGIGRGTALLLAREGAQVVAVDVDADALGRLAREIAEAGGVCVPAAADVLRADEVERMVE
ncbi:MAG TPA: SDR family NAD(P)-dependent oxidoreductase, partial [Longimicrobium sp.]|nr:SDR family NAD(P)-dependent oxidoreductase [Longimicrobium sp.]